MDGPARKIPRLLSPLEARVLGSLLEKQQTTPDLYPLTLKSLLAACNQRTNREPVMALEEGDITDALTRLQKDVLVWRESGARSIRWSHNVDRRWHLDGSSRALMTVLLLRGDQTIGELRSRTERMHSFSTLAEVEDVLRDLGRGEEPMVRELERQPGQKETRWLETVSKPASPQGPSIGTAIPSPASPSSSQEPVAKDPGLGSSLEPSRLEALEQRVEQLENDLRALRRSLGEEEPEASNEKP